MPLQTPAVTQNKALSLLSLDAGGARGISQLKMLSELMHRLNFGIESEDKSHPCDVFDVVGGIGTGGFIAILLVIVGLSVEQALEEFIELSVTILENQELNPQTRTAATKEYITNMLTKHNMQGEEHLRDLNERSKRCKLIVPISNKADVKSNVNLTNFDSNKEKGLNFTVFEALVTTLLMPPLFDSIKVTRDASVLEYVSGDLALCDPAQEIMVVACDAVGPERLLGCLLSLGCGRRGVTKLPSSSDVTHLTNLMGKLVMDGEQIVQTMEGRMGQLGIYQRFDVAKGLEHLGPDSTLDLGEMITHTDVYLTDISVSRRIDLCVDLLKNREGIASLEQLSRFRHGRRIR
ncbi:hypothetical protein M408DRAFT_27919 [Serendipita vermifera MAFF 305830]|uniref:PNPLA domain-containing protein n=1 Tax=Serendipita vermifera MAFF 305830 TaxID=933852 RepID=A0A0C2X1G1_SERVB|nr:hypothetical protein M408DRAFT_27919 [Serendipita vermifera MAFF 305830]